MKAFNVVSMAYFVLCAALQYNDPDPYLWMPIYLAAAVVCYLSLKGRFPLTLYAFLLSSYTTYAIYLFASDTGVWSWLAEHSGESLFKEMQATRPWIEETREFFGLLITIAILLANLFYYFRYYAAQRSSIKEA